MDAFAYLALAIRMRYDSGSFSFLPPPLTVLVIHLDRLGCHKSAATISGFASNLWARRVHPELNSAICHLREVLGDEVYESLVRKGETMTTAEIVAYAYDQIDQARAELNAVSK